MRAAAVIVALFVTSNCAAPRARNTSAASSPPAQSRASAPDERVTAPTAEASDASSAPNEASSSPPPPSVATSPEASSPPARPIDAIDPLVAPFDRLAHVPDPDRLERDARAYCASAFRVTRNPAGWFPSRTVLSLRHGLRIGPVVATPRAAAPSASRLLERLAPVIEHCHEQGRSRVPELHGAIVVDVATNDAGETVTSALRDTNVSVAGVSRCVARAVGRIRFVSEPRQVVMRVAVVLCPYPPER